MLGMTGMFRKALSGANLAVPGAEMDGVSELKLLDWYFGHCLDQPVPEDVDEYARSIGLASRSDLCRLLHCEREYLNITSGKELRDFEDD